MMNVGYEKCIRVSKVSAALFILLFFATHPVRAAEANWKTYMSSAYQGYVFTASHPPGWVIGNVLPNSNGFLIQNIPTSVPSVTVTANIDVYWAKQPGVIHFWPPRSTGKRDVPAEILAALKSGAATSEQMNQYIPGDGCGWLDAGGCIEFGRQPFQVSRHQGVLIEYARSKVFDPDANAVVAPEGPSEIVIYFAPNEEQMGLFIRFGLTLTRTPEEWKKAREKRFPPGIGDWVGKHRYSNSLLPAIYQELLPELFAFLETAQFRLVSELGKNSSVKLVYEGRIRTSQWNKFYATLELKLTYPPDWEIREIESTPATAERTAGRKIVVVTAPDDAASVGEPEKLLIILAGLDYHRPKNFLATTEPLVGMILPEYKQISSELVEMASLGYLAKIQTKFITGTGKTYVNTYTGKDEAGDGVKIRTYTAGGQTTVVNLIFIADSADFDRVLPIVEEMVNTAQFNLFNPIR